MSDLLNDTTRNFETLYMKLRLKEGRLYSDTEVRQLPDISAVHIHFKEWQARKESSARLFDYLSKKDQALSILEVGCGNGWLASLVAALPGSKVIGTDINFTEVEQAARVFSDKPNLHFIYGNIENELFMNKQFDIVLFAASIQYFSSLQKTIGYMLDLLKPGGEIHLIDSHFYPIHKLSAAKERSQLYYSAAGFPEMVNHYYHHSIGQLERFNYSILYDPDSLFNRFLRNRNPFHWVRIKK